MNHDNGVLGQILGDEVGAAIKLLPPPTADQPELVTAETDSIHHGRVKITFRRVEHRHHKSRHMFWHPIHAAPLGTQKSPAGSA